MNVHLATVSEMRFERETRDEETTCKAAKPHGKGMTPFDLLDPLPLISRL